jgi:hypothetical protein
MAANISRVKGGWIKSELYRFNFDIDNRNGF